MQFSPSLLLTSTGSIGVSLYFFLILKLAVGVFSLFSLSVLLEVCHFINLFKEPALCYVNFSVFTIFVSIDFYSYHYYSFLLFGLLSAFFYPPFRVFCSFYISWAFSCG